MEIYLSKVPHGFGPELLELFREFLSKFLVPNQKRCKAPLGNKRMVERQNDKVIVDNVKRMAEFSRVPHSGHVFHVRPVLAKKAHQLRRRLVGKAENHTMVNSVLGCVSSDSPKNREALAARSPCSRYDQIRFLAVVR
jgi:hypothetical protein